ncbi:hypothetical protein JXB11_00235 [Candidatus Woesearchaeota archaeon]|nr:hypothetical protein [Candidatus Woesearchaeota archaeon]
MRGLKAIIILLVISLLASVAYAAEPDMVVSNSAQWQDVYSVMLFSSISDYNSAFLVSDRHSVLLADSMEPGTHVWVVSSDTSPFTLGYGSYLEGRGFTSESFTYENINLELGRQLDTTSFIVVDDSYGYNAISVAPYAVASNSYVVFADLTNIGEVDDFLSDKGATNVIIYGHVDRIVKDTLTANYNTEIINIDGDRFANNIEIVKRYQEIAHSKQVILTNGEFIEQEIMSGKEPVIFIGRNNVPEIVRQYIAGSEITVGVLIGNELVNTATFIRRQIGISVFVKFARSARSPDTAISQVEALDMFYLPVYSLGLEVDSLSYNRATGQLEVVLRNTQDLAVYFRGSYTITLPDGTRLTVGDADAVFIEPNSYKTMTYSLDSLPEGSVIDLYIIYGESKNSLEYVIDEQYCMSCAKKFSIIDIIDNCEINMSSVSYSLPRKLFYVEISNIGPVGCYVDVELPDVIVAAERVTYHLEDVAFVEIGETRELKIKGALEEEDLEDNEFVNAKAYYGQRENSLVKFIEGRFPLNVITSYFSAAMMISYGLLAIIIILVALLVWRFYFAKRRRKRQE